MDMIRLFHLVSCLSRIGKNCPEVIGPMVFQENILFHVIISIRGCPSLCSFLRALMKAGIKTELL
jgi:hypothetical protein